MSALRDRLRAVLLEHRYWHDAWVVDVGGCSCGKAPARDQGEWREHFLDVLEAAVPLPRAQIPRLRTSRRDPMW